MGRKSTEKKLKRAQMRKEEEESYNLVRKAQAILNPLDGLPAFQKYMINETVISITYSEADKLDEATVKWIIDLEKRNMEDIYNSCSWGWNDKKKLKEMTESEARYLIAKIESQPVGFAHFRFDMDYGDPVLYCYELQLEEKVRRKGLGKFLLQVLELMAFKNNMRKVILTVLKHNKSAINFFYSLKYERDETNPVEYVHEEIPYEILSKFNKKFTLAKT